jgi:hypothetical protein
VAIEEVPDLLDDQPANRATRAAAKRHAFTVENRSIVRECGDGELRSTKVNSGYWHWPANVPIPRWLRNAHGDGVLRQIEECGPTALEYC